MLRKSKSKEKKPRARSKEKKDEKFRTIIEAGRKLFLMHVAQSFTIRKLVENVNMN